MDSSSFATFQRLYNDHRGSRRPLSDDWRASYQGALTLIAGRKGLRCGKAKASEKLLHAWHWFLVSPSTQWWRQTHRASALVGQFLMCHRHDHRSRLLAWVAQASEWSSPTTAPAEDETSEARAALVAMVAHLQAGGAPPADCEPLQAIGGPRRLLSMLGPDGQPNENLRRRWIAEYRRVG